MRLLDLCLIGAHAQPGEPSVRLGVPRARTVMEDGRRFLGFRHLSPGRVLRRKRQVPSETGNLTTDRDGPVMDCYGFRSLGPVRDPLRTGPRPVSWRGWSGSERTICSPRRGVSRRLRIR
jgi:hypothetical protein